MLTGRVSLTFDDANDGIYTYGLPALKQYNIKATIYPIVGGVENNEEWLMDWTQLTDLKNAGWEVGSHSMTHPSMSTLTDDQIEYELSQSKLVLANHGFAAKSFAFPYGDYNYNVLDRVTRHYESSRMAWGNINNFPDRYLIKVREITKNTSVATVQTWINSAVTNKQWLVLMFHDIVSGTPSDYQYKASNLALIAKYLRSKNIPTPTITEGLNFNLGTNLIKNGNLEEDDGTGWAKGWTRDDTTAITRINAPVTRIYSSGKVVQLLGAASSKTLNPTKITLPSSTATYNLSMLADVPDATGGTGVWIDEYNSAGDWISGKWAGGIYEPTVSMPSYKYKPSSYRVKAIDINFYTEPQASGFLCRADNFYFGLAN
jgi:peptidoglycan/xylan/chitin deacetylase (PgdA/CDA1 family)